MKLLNILFVILIEGLVSFVFLHGAVIGSKQNEVFSKTTEDMEAAMGEHGLQQSEKVLMTGSNHILPVFRAAHTSKTEDLENKSKKKKERKNKGKGRKRDPCLKKYRTFCIHGECRYIKSEKAPSCVCQVGYYGERCHALILPLENPSNNYDHTTVLAVIAVALSSFCLIVISCLLILRCHRRGAYNVENGEKLKFGHPT